MLVTRADEGGQRALNNASLNPSQSNTPRDDDFERSHSSNHMLNSVLRRISIMGDANANVTASVSSGVSSCCSFAKHCGALP